MKSFILAIVCVLGLTESAFAKLQIGAVPPQIKIEGDKGGRIDGSPWDSAMLKGKVFSLFYVDPDEKDSNPIMEDILGKQDFPKDRYQSVGIINMEATWMPNFAIASALASKQEKFPDVIYVKDEAKSLVKEWGVKDDAYVVLLFDKQGRLIFQHAGVLDEKQSNELAALIKKHLNG